jgi:hypothetical protein
MPPSQGFSKGREQANYLLTSMFKPFKNAFANLEDAGIVAVSFLSSVLNFLKNLGGGGGGGVGE